MKRTKTFIARKEHGDQAMKFEKENRRIKMLWFKYDSITTVLTMTGLVVLCFQKYFAINRLKKECLEYGFEHCRNRMYEERYEYNDVFAYIVMAMNIASIVAFLMGQKYKARWYNMKLSNYDSVSNKGNFCQIVDWFFFLQILLLIIGPIP